MRFRIRVTGIGRAAAFVWLVLAASGVAENAARAGERSITIANTVFQLGGNATQSGHFVSLAETGLSIFSVPLVVPADYKKNTPIEFAVNVYVMDNTPCKIAFTPLSLLRGRPGKIITSGIAGLKPAGNNPVAKLSANYRLARKVFVLKPGGSLAGQKPGDTLYVALARDGDDGEDSCGSSTLFSVEVTYTTK